MAKEVNLIYLDRNRFDFYSEVQNQIYNFDLTSFAANLEFVNQQALGEQIKSFVDTNKIPSGNTIIILSENLLFVKALPQISQDKEEEEIKKFTNSVPFEHISTRTYPIENGKLLVAVNREFYATIEKYFEKSNIKTTLVAPIYSTQSAIDANSAMDATTAKTILHNVETIRPNGIEIIKTQDAEVAPQVQPQTPTKEPTNKGRLFAMLGVFGMLIVVLIFVTINALKPEPPKTQPANNQIAAVSPTPLATDTQIASSGGTLVAKDLRLKVFAPQNSTILSNLTKSLSDSGFLNITNEINRSQSANPIIIFSPTVDQQFKTQIINSVSQFSANPQIQESQNPDADVLIFINQ